MKHKPITHHAMVYVDRLGNHAHLRIYIGRIGQGRALSGTLVMTNEELAAWRNGTLSAEFEEPGARK